jgi:SAM-dependent methyltransferase
MFLPSALPPPTMSLFDRIHEGFVFGRRVRMISDHLAKLMPPSCDVLDVGCGDCSVGASIVSKRRDVVMSGVDVVVRNRGRMPIITADGKALPFPDESFAVVMLVDVLHHTRDPMILLREAARVARRCVIIKDHTADGVLADPILRFMDRVGNSRHGVALYHNYWPRTRWLEAFDDLGLVVAEWVSDLGIYPWPTSWIFGRSLHFAALLDK